MKKAINFFITFALVAIFSINSLAAISEEEITKLRTNLKESKTPQDSIKYLYDLFDVLPRKERIEIGRKIYEISTRIQDTPTRLEILRQLSTNFEEDAPLALIQMELNKIPSSSSRDEHLLFIKMRRIHYKVKNLSESERQKEIVNLIHKYDGQRSNDRFQKILDLYTLVAYLHNDAPGDMLKSYLDQLIKEVDSANIDFFAIKNLVYSEAANIYSDSEEPDKAIEINAKLLKVIENFEKAYAAKGRIYRNFDRSRYLVDRRMLRNYKVLKPGEAQKYFDDAMQRIADNPDVRAEDEKSPRIRAYYYMATGDYNSAVNILKELINQNNSLPVHKRLLEMLIESSQKTGDNTTLINALTKYVAILTDLNELRASEKSKELHIRYDLDDLKKRNKDLQTENRENEIASERSIMTLLCVAFILILIALIFFLVNWSRYRSNTARMGRVVDNMHKERHKLRDNLYAEYEDQDPLVVEERFSRMIWERRMKDRRMHQRDATIFMTESIINDLLYIAWLGHHDLIKHIVRTSADAVMREAETRARESLETAVPISIEYPDRDIEMHTDAECLIAIFSHIFIVSTNFKNTTEVTMLCEQPESGYIDFIITLEGSFRAGLEGPQIFKDMPMSEILLNHKNSGMYVCRAISLLIQCELIPDKSYDSGARYRLRVPLNIRS